MPAGLKQLISKRDKLPDGERLPRHEQAELRRETKRFYSNPEYVALMTHRNRWLDDALKKVAAGIIKQLAQRKIEVFVVGRNKGQKQGSDMGRKQNRTSHNLAHVRLINFIKNAAQTAGILVLTTEESYTSKISFANNTPLRKYEEKEQPVTREETTHTPANDVTRTNLPGNGKMEHRFGGKRGTTKDTRHVYTNVKTGKKPANWRKRVHADINGAFNILRKVLPWFKFNPTLTFSYDLFWLSPKHGLSAMNFEAGHGSSAGCA